MLLEIININLSILDQYFKYLRINYHLKIGNNLF